MRDLPDDARPEQVAVEAPRRDLLMLFAIAAMTLVVLAILIALTR